MEQVKEIIAPKIFAAISGVISDVGYVAKDKVNKQQGFKYRSVDDVFNALHPALAKNKVFIVPRILEQTREIVGKTQKGINMTLVVCKIEFSFYAEDGSNITAVIVGEGLDTGDKATNKAMAVAYKYACFQVFCIPTEEMIDPDAERPELEQKNAGKAAAKPKETADSAEVSGKPQAEKAKAEQPEMEKGQRLTVEMLNTIRSEQKRTGVSDKAILARKAVTAKKIEEMTVQEFKAVMEVFKITPDLKREDNNEQC